MKYRILTFFFIFAIQVIWGQKFTLEGEVLDGSNRYPLAFANVILEGTSLGSASDNEGKGT